MSDFKTQRLVEAIEVLAGTRTHGRTGAAVRVSDLDRLARYNHRLQAETVNAAPTATQHNALVSDLKAIHGMLEQISKALRDRGGMQG
ncbi:hypothetical protein ACRRRS_21890 (plasmid) [Brucella anthropi]|uniref:hypothetical protein n=1 Tax=Brucella anthropi TaxID=529 RepID=UPI003D7C9F39